MPAEKWSILSSTRRKIEYLRTCKPGVRFISLYVSRQRPPSVRSVAATTVGFLLVAIGIGLGFLPFSPGIIFVLCGAALISSHNRMVARLLDASEMLARSWCHHFRKNK